MFSFLFCTIGYVFNLLIAILCDLSDRFRIKIILVPNSYFKYLPRTGCLAGRQRGAADWGPGRTPAGAADCGAANWGSGRTPAWAADWGSGRMLAGTGSWVRLGAIGTMPSTGGLHGTPLK